MTQVPIIRAVFARADIILPIAGDVSIKATFWRDRNSGDLLGYEQALADFLQEPVQRNGKTVRKGSGVILDDRQVVSWDGSRLAKDAGRPRIEITIEVVRERAVPLALNLEEEW
jgi:hypothetical protein